MHSPIIRKAALLLNQGRVLDAYQLYREAAKRYGVENFQYNLFKCRQLIPSFNEFDLRLFTRDVPLPRQIDAENVATGPAHDLNKKSPVNFEFETNRQKEIAIKYSAITNVEESKKDLVLKVEFYNADGNEIKAPSYYASSKDFSAYKYIVASKSYVTRKLILPCPKEAIKVRTSIHLFNKKIRATLVGLVKVPHTKELSREGLNRRTQFEELLKKAERMPVSNGSRHFVKYDLTIGFIGDVYMYNFYKDVCKKVIYLSPNNFEYEFSKNKIDLVIYTTCWKGIRNEEWRGVKFREKPKYALDSILEMGKEQMSKLVFQSIEDPSNYDYFLPIAMKFDYIFTTDVDCIERYKEDCGHDNVFFGEYGVNPQMNNPIGSRREIENAFFFAGSYTTRYKERCADMTIILDSIIEAGGDLYIADRNYETDDASVNYPLKYSEFIVPPVEHTTLQNLHKLFRFNLNFNSIKKSSTMCAMRVYELQAQCNGFMSNYANSVYNNFPGVKIVTYKQDFTSYIKTDENWEEYYKKVANARSVLNNKTSFDVFSQLLKNIEIELSVIDNNYSIAVIADNRTIAEQAMLTTQSLTNLVYVSTEDAINNTRWEELVKRHHIKYFTFAYSNNEYERHYLQDMINSFKYVDVDYVTKAAHFNGNKFISGPQHEYVNQCAGLFKSLFSTKYLIPDDLLRLRTEESFALANGYALDPFELNYMKYRELTKKPSNSEYALSVIVPVYNNARFLTTKCLPSLFSNTRWQEFEIILVDDGSIDSTTLDVLEELKRIYRNVVVIRNDGDGSGSASRPRNQGVDAASANLITFLDPDNEICLGGYDQLLEQYQNNPEVDFISGFHVKVAETVKIIGRHTDKPMSVIKDPSGGYFKHGKFPVVATQSAIISKEFLNKKNIRFVEGAAGQDTLFGWEILAKSAKCGFTGDVFIVYYAERADSITNAVDVNYFEKKLVLEKAQVEFLKEEGLVEIYLKHHYDNFMNAWYLEKLKLANDKDMCLKVLQKIKFLYGKDKM